MSAVKTLAVEVSATPEAIEKCRDASHGETVRYIILKLEKENVDFVSSGDKAGSAASDFDKLKTLVTEKEPNYIFYRYRDEGEAQWALISWLPESTPVKSRMVYASSVVSTSVLIGTEKVSKQMAINTLKQLVWEDFHVDEVKLKNKTDFLAEENDASMPFSNRELAQRQVDREERQARVEMGTKSKEASGFHSVAFPLASEAEQAIKDMLTGAHNWVQLSLDSTFKSIELREKKTASSVSGLGDLLHKTEPQFYLYLFKDNVPILIYCCPEKGPTIKNKMVYSTCKSTLAENILQCGFSDIKKLDIREASDLTESELNDAYAAKASFKPSESSNSGAPVQLAGPKPGGNRYGGIGALGGLGAVIASKAAKRTPNQ
jgi:twinfilin-like protein